MSKKMHKQVAHFIEEKGLRMSPEFRALDFLAEAGEIASDVTKSSEYGKKKEGVEVKKDEIGDALFSLLALADSLKIDAEEALQKSLRKYKKRIEQKGDPGSG